MKPIQALFLFATLAALPMTAQDLAAPAALTETRERPSSPDPKEAPQAHACLAKGCPKQDQHGHGPKSCIYQSGLATAFKCILLCTYADSQWGTIVASNNCQ